MIFVTTGSQKFQFNRLIKKIDELVEEGVIRDKVFAQIGSSDYIPKNFEYCDFMNREDFQSKLEECSMVITHGGTGVIIGAVKKGKKVIAVPRLAKYGEHVDDHQVQLLQQFGEMGLIESCFETEDLGTCYKEALEKEFLAYESNTQTIIDDIEHFLTEEKKETEVPVKETRIDYLDAAKGIAIFLVCVGHAISNRQNVRDIDLPILLRFISQFHMPLFFVINGILFSDKYIRHPVRATLHKFKVYYIPFVAYNLLFLLLHNVFAALHLVNDSYHGGAYDLKQFLYRFAMIITGHRQSFGGAMWFLGSLLIMSVLFIWAKYFIKCIIPKKLQEPCLALFVVGCVLVGISGRCPTSFKLNVTMYSILFYYLGYLYTKFSINVFLAKYKTIVFISGFVANVVIAYLSPVGIAGKYYANFPLFAVAAVLGALMVLMLSQYSFVKKLKVLKLLGRESLAVMSLHFLSFKIVSLIIILVYNMPVERLAEYPVIMGVGGLWWVVYSMVGAFASAGAHCGYRRLIGIIKNGV